MADSVHFLLTVPDSVPTVEVLRWNLPFQIGVHGNQDDFFQGFGTSTMADVRVRTSAKLLFQEWMTFVARSGAEFKVRGVWHPTIQGRLLGYEIKMNVPTCMVGHNALLDNSVPRSTELATLQFKLCLLDRGIHPAAVEPFNVETAILLSVTPTEMHDGTTTDGALAGRDAFKLHTELANAAQESEYRDDRPTAGTRPKPPAFSVGAGLDFTSYLKSRELSQCCYVKNRYAASVASHTFPNEEIRHQIFDVAETRTRHEAESKPTFLARLKLTTVESWRRYGSESAYERYFTAARKRARLDEDLRSRRPKPEDIAKLQMPDREMLEWHFEGRNVRFHPAVDGHSTLIERQKYFSAVRLRVLERMRIDFKIPWAIQSRAASAGAHSFFQPKTKAGVPRSLADACFTSKSTLLVKNELELEVVQRSNALVRQRGLRDYPVRRLAAIDVGTLELDPDLILMDRIEVEPAARELLDRQRKPLYPYLDLHGLGCFGDVTLDEVDRNKEEMARRGTVRSTYLLGKGRLRIETTYRPDEHGELLPHVRVHT